METMQQFVWLQEPELPFEEGEVNPECGIDFCKTKCCGCDVKVICSPVIPA